jgi:LPXTG-motif cell wall-anchored protein
MKNIRYILAGLAAAFLALAPSAAWASEKPDQYVTVVWQMPSWEIEHNMPLPSWPQKLFSYSEPTTSDNYVETALPTCGYIQRDVYRYTTYTQVSNVDNLIAGGVLTAPNKPYPESVVRSELVNLGECVSESPTPSPTPTPSVTPSPTPSPTITPSPSESATPSSTPSTSKSQTPTPTLPKTGPTETLAVMGVFGLLCVLGGIYMVVQWRKP